MKKIIGAAILTLVLLGFAGFYLLIRYGGVQIQDNATSKILMGYDQDNDTFLINEYKEASMDGPDGPYVSLTGDSLSALYVEESNENISIVSARHSIHTPLVCRVDNDDRDSFQISIHPSDSVQPADYPLPAKLLAISDIEGNFESLFSLLVNQQVMDSSFQWRFGSNHLVLVGDMVDRGRNVLPCLWLIYHLEQQALLEGGHVHFILGNHELMNFQANTAYVHDRYRALAKKISGQEDQREAYAALLSRNSVLVNWMKNKNCIERIGNILFVHGGLSSTLLDEKLSMDEINSTVRASVQSGRAGDDRSKLLLGKNGPLWYRGLVEDETGSQDIVQKALSFYAAEYIVVGHTMVNEVSRDKQGKVIRIDVRHGDKKFSSDSQALLVDAGRFYRVDGSGSKKEI